MKNINELNFGFPDAENYKRRENKTFFNDLFIKNEYLEQLCQPQVSFLIGDKGTGKTAYSLYLANNRYQNNIGFSKFIRETDYQKFIILKKKKDLQLSDYTSIWKVILLLLLSEEVYENEPNLDILKNFGKFKYLHDVIDEYYLSAFSSEINQAMQFIEESKYAAELMSKHAKMAGEEKETKTFNENRFQINLFYIEKKFKEALSKIKLKNNHILFIDGIDIRPDSVPFGDYLECIKGLANAIWGLNNDFFPTIKDTKGKLRVVLLVRPDIFESLGLQNLNTKIRSNSVLLDWTTEYKTYENSKLFLLINHLLNTQQDNKTSNAWQHYFPYNAPKTELLNKNDYTSFIEFVRYSYHRPRDIISMLDILKENNQHIPLKNYFEKKDFDNSAFKSKYSNYILGEIKDQLLFYYQLEEYELFLKFFEFLNGKIAFDYKEYLKLFDKYTQYINSTSKQKPKFTTTANEFLQFLYDLNIICYIEYSKDGQEKFFHWCFKEKSYSNLSPKIKENREYQIFYSLTKALNLGKEFSNGVNEQELIYFSSSESSEKEQLHEQLQNLGIR
jgi:hypothetical protein